MHTYRAHFMWQVDDKAVFSYGQADEPEFFSLDAPRWQDLGEPRELIISVAPVYV